MNIFQTYWLVLIILLSSISLDAQSWSVQHFTTEDGLPGNIAYDIFQDKDGYIWIPTNNGLCRYNGNEFTLYDSPLIKNNEILKCKETMGLVWFYTFSGSFFYIEHNEIKQFSFDNKQNIIQWKGLNENNMLVVSMVGGGLYQIDRVSKEGDSFDVKTLKQIKNNFMRVIMFRSNKDLYVFTQKEIYRYDFEKDELVLELDGLNFFSATSVYEDTSQTLLLEIAESEYYSFKGKKITPFEGISRIFNHKKNGDGRDKLIYKDSKERFWYRYSGEIWLMDSLADPNPRDYSSIVDFNYCNALFEDREGNIWFSTNNNGIYVLYNSPFLHFNVDNSDLKSNFIYDIDGDEDGMVYFASADGYLTAMKGTEIIDVAEVKCCPSKEIYDVLVTKDKQILLAMLKPTLYEFDQIEKEIIEIYQVEEVRNFFQAKRFDEKKNGDILGALTSFVGTLEKERFVYFPTWVVLNVKPYAVLPYKDEFILAGTTNGLYEFGAFDGPPDTIRGYFEDMKRDSEYSMKNIAILPTKDRWKSLSKQKKELYSYPVIRKKIFKGNETIDYFIHDLQYGKDESSIWIASKKNGAYKIVDDSIQQHYTASEFGLTSNICNRLFVDDNDKVWVSTMNGISLIDPAKNTIRKITTDDGLISNHINSVYVYDSLVYVGTSKGLTVFHEKDIEAVGPAPPLWITGLKVNERDTLIQNSYKLSYKENSIYLNFNGLSYKGNVNYKYRMKGLSNQWVYTENNYLRFPELQTGKYTFEVLAITKDGVQSESAKRIEFKIKPHPLKSIWAFIIYALIFVLGVFAYSQIRINNIRQKEKDNTSVNKKIAELELQALQAQMNPHFVFNALGAIQSFIIQNDDQNANRYLSDFADLMRLFLESSKEKYINLSDEIRLLEIYVKLEELRFEDKFETSFEIDPAIDPENFEIPSLLLQPFVENSINHGLRYKKEKGRLLIQILLKENVLTCVVEDDGVGREKSREIQEVSFKGYKSRGTQIVEERLKALNLLEESTIDIQVIDLVENQQSLGTRVVINITLE